MKEEKKEDNKAEPLENLQIIGAKWSVAASVSTIVAPIVGIILQVNAQQSIGFLLWFVLSAIMAFVILLVFFYKSISLRKQKELKAIIQTRQLFIEQAYAKNIHNICEIIHGYVHNVRDWQCRCVAETKNAQTFYAACTQICNLAVTAYNCLWNADDNKYTIAACIKRIIPAGNNYTEWQLETIARSANTDIARINNENAHTKPITVQGNADFQIILDQNTQDTSFACTNLEKVKEVFKEKYSRASVKEYCNTTESYIDYYKSTIVVPIRIALVNTKADLKLNEGHTHHVVGFLCIDTKEIFEDGDVLFEAGVDLAKVFADSIYKIFEDNIIYNNT